MIWIHECFNDNTEGKVKNRSKLVVRSQLIEKYVPFSLIFCPFFFNSLGFFSDIYLPLGTKSHFTLFFGCRPLGPWSKTNLPFERDKVSLGSKPPPLAEWDTPNIALLGSIFFLIERYTKIILFSAQRVPWIAFLAA